MSFGPLEFQARLTAKGLWGRWIAVYLSPLALTATVGVMFALGSSAVAAGSEGGGFSVIHILIVSFVVFYIAIPLLVLAFYAKYYREAAERTTLGELSFSFEARTWDWVKLFLGNVALAVVTLGFGLTYWGYRNWAFMIRHAHLYGNVDLSSLSQSTVRSPGEAEGFADMFDVGAI